jgi:molybdopterin-guanine dinucleotide biosynthesis protein A
MEYESVTLAIIGGGVGRRMGVPKAWLRFGDESILSWHIRRLQWPGPTMLITSPSTANPPDAEWFDRQFVDPMDGAGPLQGVFTALEHATTSLVVVTAIDMPAVDCQALAWMAESLATRSDCLGVMCRRKSETGNLNLIEPFPSSFRRSAGPVIAELLKQGRRSMHRLCDDPAFLALDPPADWPADLWTNLNEPGQLEAYQAKMNLQRLDAQNEN